jgi:AbrB family looped-hinge helix DNA binding protein
MRIDESVVQVRERGIVTIPARVRERHGIRPGDPLRLIEWDGVLVLTPIAPMVKELAEQIERQLNEAGHTTEELLQELRRQRERYYQEHYAPHTDPQATGLRRR